MTTLGALYGHTSTNSSSIRKGKSSSNSNQGSNKPSTATSNVNPTSTESTSKTNQLPQPTIPRQSIILLGLRRSGKTSILKVVHGRLSPNDTLFLDSTTKPNFKLVDSFSPLRFWDLPGSNQSYTFPISSNPQSQNRPTFTGNSAGNTNSNAGASGNASGSGSGSGNGDASNAEQSSPPDYHKISAIIFVIDSQDDYFDSLGTLHETILKVHTVNRNCQFHVFIHKVDGLSDDYKWDTQRDIEQRIFDDLSDASGSFVYSNSPTNSDDSPDHQDLSSNSKSQNHSIDQNQKNQIPTNSTSSTTSPENLQSSISQYSQVNLETSVPLTFHLTSIFDSSVFIAFSRVQSALVNSSLSDAVEGVCSSLCTSCTFDKVMLLDVPSRTYVGLDAGPFDAGSFDVASEYVSFLGEMSSLYSNLPRKKRDEDQEDREEKEEEHLPPNAIIEKSIENQFGKEEELNEDDEEEIENQGRYASSSAKLNPDTTVGFWQMNNHLALVATLRTEAHLKQAGLIDYNVTFFRRAIQQLYEIAQYGGE